MHLFSSAIAEMYQAAQTVSSSELRNQLLEQARRIIKFDGAILGVSRAGVSTWQPAIVQTHVYLREPELISDYKKIGGTDALAVAYAAGIAQPLRFQARPCSSRLQQPGWIKFAKKHNLAQLLFFGNAPTTGSEGNWIILCRGDPGAPFVDADADNLLALWPHLVRAQAVQLQRALNRQDMTASHRSLALIDYHGRIEIADPPFRALLRQEIGEETGQRIPEHIWQALMRNSTYSGKRIDITAKSNPEHVVCEAHAVRAINRLGPIEREVAAQFAGGLDYKSIAISMGTSPHTVRNQLSQIYKKLAIHNKASLALLLHAGSH